MTAASPSTATAASTFARKRDARDWLKDQVRRVRGWIGIAAAAGLAAGWLIILQAGLFAGVVAGAVSRGAGVADLASGFAWLAAVIVLRALLQWLQEASGAEAGLRVRRQVRHELLDRIARLGPVRLDRYHSAGLAGQLLEHSEALHGYFARFLPQLFLAVAVPLSILAVVTYLDWLAAVFLLAAAPLIPLFMVLVGMGAERLNRRQFETLSRLAGLFLDRVRGLSTLQLFGHTGRSTAEVAQAADEYRRRSMRTLRVAFLSSAVLEFFAAVAIAVIAIYIGFGLLGFIDFGPAPELSLFSGLFILLLAPEFFQPLRNLSQHYHDRAAARAAAGILLELLNRPDGCRAVATPADHGPEALVLADIRVRYPGRGRVLGPLSVTLEPGCVTVVCGESGAGKSTLLYVLAGFLTPDSGEIRGRPPCAWLDQRPFLLYGSVADNLRLAAPAAADGDLVDVLGKVGLDAWLQQQPAGLATRIGERGTGLSGGQAQRLALARVFLSGAPLVLLDEPTAHLDPRSEAIVLDALRALAAAGRTLVIASHHPAVRAMADRVLQLRAGRLIGDD